MGPDLASALGVIVVAAIVAFATWYRIQRMPADLADKRRVFNAEVGNVRRVIVHAARFTSVYVGMIAEVVDDGVLIQLRTKVVSIPFNDIVALSTSDKSAIGVWGANPSFVDTPVKEVR